MSKKINPVGLEICQAFVEAVRRLDNTETGRLIEQGSSLYDCAHWELREKAPRDVFDANRLACGISHAHAFGHADVLATLPAGSEDPTQARDLISPLKRAGADELAYLVKWRAGLK